MDESEGARVYNKKMSLNKRKARIRKMLLAYKEKDWNETENAVSYNYSHIRDSSSSPTDWGSELIGTVIGESRSYCVKSPVSIESYNERNKSDIPVSPNVSGSRNKIKRRESTHIETDDVPPSPKRKSKKNKHQSINTAVENKIDQPQSPQISERCDNSSDGFHTIKSEDYNNIRQMSKIKRRKSVHIDEENSKIVNPKKYHQKTWVGFIDQSQTPYTSSLSHTKLSKGITEIMEPEIADDEIPNIKKKHKKPHKSTHIDFYEQQQSPLSLPEVKTSEEGTDEDVEEYSNIRKKLKRKKRKSKHIQSNEVIDQIQSSTTLPKTRTSEEHDTTHIKESNFVKKIKRKHHILLENINETPVHTTETKKYSIINKNYKKSHRKSTLLKLDDMADKQQSPVSSSSSDTQVMPGFTEVYNLKSLMHKKYEDVDQTRSSEEDSSLSDSSECATPKENKFHVKSSKQVIIEAPQSPVESTSESYTTLSDDLDMERSSNSSVKEILSEHSDSSDDLLELLSLSASPQNTDEDSLSSLEDPCFDFNETLAKTIRKRLNIAKMNKEGIEEAVSDDRMDILEKIEETQEENEEQCVYSSSNQSPEPSEDEVQIDNHTEQVDNELSELSEPSVDNNNFEINVDEDCDRTADVRFTEENVQVISNSEDEIVHVDQNLYTRIEIFKVGSLCIFALKHPMKIHIKGKIKVKTIAGSVKLFGHILQRDRSYDVFAVKHNHCLVLETIENEIPNINLFIKLTDIGMSMLDARNLNACLERNDAVICLQDLNSRKFDFIEQVFNKGDIFMNDKNDDTVFSPAVMGLSCSLYVNSPPKSFNTNPEWETLLKSEQSVLKKVLICGGKNFGKSTFLRYYVNTMLNKVNSILVLDLDPGQSEFTVSGNISATVVNKPLFGPNFTHIRKPDYMLHLGMINVSDSLQRYVIGVAKLVNYCSTHEKYRDMPWVVNTMGMTTDIGARLIVYIISCIKPTVLIQFHDGFNKKGFSVTLKADVVKDLYKSVCDDVLFENIQFSDLDYKFILYQQCSDTNTCLAANEYRLLNYIAYFGELLDTNPTMGFLGIVPYEVPIGDLCVVTNVPIEGCNVAKILNGKIVALCISNEARTMKNDKAITLQKEALPCIGFGLIRAVDLARGRAFVITPVPVSLLCTVNTIVYTDWTPELNVCPPLGVFVPYRMPTPDDARLLRPARRRFNPLQLMKATTKVTNIN